MSQYQYSSLSPGSNSIRLLRLMPYRDTSLEWTEIQCELFEYHLRDEGKGTHLYEALSYAWGGQEKPRSITINKQNLAITENLHAALLRLRDRSLERVLWADAICINQENPEEQGQQVQLMAKIYSKATGVLVWLGETAEDTEGALESIQLAVNGDSLERPEKEINQQVIFNLLQRPWFERIWVLQEVAAARHIVMMCGSIEIDGYAFCLGLKSLQLSYAAFPELQSLPLVTYLIEQAGLRSKHTTNSSKRFSLEIRCLAELIDMFHTRKASDVRDKIYALLGMSSDDPSKAGLQPDYKASWKELFQQLVKFILGNKVSVETSNYSQRAVIKSKGYVLSQVISVRNDERQNINITCKNTTWLKGNKSEWTLQASAKSIQEGDIVCLLQGATKPTIIRLCKDYSTIVVIAAAPLRRSGSFEEPEIFRSIKNFPRNFLLIWDWEKPIGESPNREEYKPLANATNQLQEYSKREFGDRSHKMSRTLDVAIILDDIDEFEKAEERLQEAGEHYEIASRQDHLYKSNSQYGRTTLLWIAGNGYDELVHLLLAKVYIDLDLKDIKSGRTALSWAAGEGHEAVVKLLLETGAVDVDSLDNDHKTPLSWAAKEGHDAVVMLLLEKGAKLETKDKFGRMPLSYAAQGGHEAMVKLLLEKGTKLETKDYSYETALSYAVNSGHEAVVKLLLENGAELEIKDKFGKTALSCAAQGGQEAVVKLLLEEGAKLETKDKFGRMPLSYAAQGGHEAVVKLLLEKDAKLETKDHYGQTALLYAVQGGHEAVLKLLLETGANVKVGDDRGTTPLSRTAQGGHEAVVKLLLEKGAGVEAEDINGQTALSNAAQGGHEAVVKLLLEKGAMLETMDNYCRTPLSYAIDYGHEVVAELLRKRSIS